MKFNVLDAKMKKKNIFTFYKSQMKMYSEPGHWETSDQDVQGNVCWEFEEKSSWI